MIPLFFSIFLLIILHSHILGNIIVLVKIDSPRGRVKILTRVNYKTILEGHRKNEPETIQVKNNLIPGPFVLELFISQHEKNFWERFTSTE